MCNNEIFYPKHYSFSGKFQMGFHTHSSLEINYVSQGVAEYVFENTSISLKKGNMIILNAAAAHRLDAVDCGMKLSGIEIPLTEPVQAFMQEIFTENECGYVITPDRLCLLVFYDLIGIAYDRRPSVPCAQAYFLELIRRELEGRPAAKVKNYIAANYAAIESIEEIASVFHISSSHLQRVFREQTGRTIGNYLTSIRLAGACYLLKNTAVPVGEIDRHVGFRSRQSFYTQFKLKYQISPSEYRRKMKEKEK